VTNLDRRLTELESRFRPPPAPLLILVTGMARAGFRYVPTRIALGDGRVLDRDDDEAAEAFEARAHDLALAALPEGRRVAVAHVVDGEEVPDHEAATGVADQHLENQP
jgi:hypothetical protein